MTDQSVIVQNPVGIPTTAGQLGKKPAHLLTLLSTPGLKGVMKEEFFIALDKPDFSTAPGFILARGFVVGGCAEDKIKKDWAAFISEASKDEIEEVYFPMHRVVSVKSLVYRAK